MHTPATAVRVITSTFWGGGHHCLLHSQESAWKQACLKRLHSALQLPHCHWLSPSAPALKEEEANPLSCWCPCVKQSAACQLPISQQTTFKPVQSNLLPCLVLPNAGMHDKLPYYVAWHTCNRRIHLSQALWLSQAICGLWLSSTDC